MRQSQRTNAKLEDYLQNLLRANYPVLRDALANAIKPIPETTIEKWSEGLYLPQEMTSEYGQYRMSRTPYIREICECLHPLSPYNEVIFVAAAQVSKTQLMMNNIFFNIVNAYDQHVLRHINAESRSH